MPQQRRLQKKIFALRSTPHLEAEVLLGLQGAGVPHHGESSLASPMNYYYSIYFNLQQPNGGATDANGALQDESQRGSDIAALEALAPVHNPDLAG
jgi:hypothetical protein